MGRALGLGLVPPGGRCWRGHPEATLMEMVMGQKEKLLVLGVGLRVGDPHPWRCVKLHCAGPCGTQSVTEVSLVLGRSSDLRPPKSFPGLVWGGWWLLAHFHSLLMNKQRRIISLQTGTGLVRSGAFNFFLNCCSS